MAVQKVTPEQAKAIMSNPTIKAAPEVGGAMPQPSGGSDKFTWQTTVTGSSQPVAEGATENPPWVEAAVTEQAEQAEHTDEVVDAGLYTNMSTDMSKPVGGFMASKMAAKQGVEEGPVPVQEPNSKPYTEDEDAPKVVTDQGAPMATETTQFKGQPEKAESYTVEPIHNPSIAPEDLAHVSVNLGLTINLGEFSSAKVGVSLSMPTAVADVDATYDFAKEWAEARISTMADEVVKGE